MTAALGSVRRMAFRLARLTKTKGNSKSAAPENRNNVSENGLMMPANFSEARNEPATKIVASNTKRWCLSLVKIMPVKMKFLN